MGPMSLNTVIDTLQQLNQYVQNATTIDDVVAVLSLTLGAVLGIVLKLIEKKYEKKPEIYQLSGVAALIIAGASVVIVGQLYGLQMGLMSTLNGGLSVLGGQKTYEIVHGGSSLAKTTIQTARSGSATAPTDSADNS